VESKKGKIRCMSSYHLTQLYPQILAVSDSVTMGLAILGVILLITLGAIWKYPQVGSVLQLWAAFGTLTGAMTRTTPLVIPAIALV